MKLKKKKARQKGDKLWARGNLRYKKKLFKIRTMNYEIVANAMNDRMKRQTKLLYNERKEFYLNKKKLD